MSPETRNRAGFAATLALFAALAFFALRSGRAIYETGPEIAVREEAGAIVLGWEGAVAAPMAHRFRDAFEAVKGESDRIVIELASPGGALIEGRAVIAEIERMKKTHAVETRVRDGDLCTSMCVPIFLAGEARIAGPSSRFMFHEPTSVDVFTEEEERKPAFEKRMDAERFFERYFERSPMDPQWREKLRRDW